MANSAQIAKEVAYAETLDVKTLTGYFKEISDDAGAAYAYEVLRQLPSAGLEPYKHLFGHIIGDELFYQQNIAGLGICTPEFSFACYHSVISRAIAEEGLENIGEINRRCLELVDVGSCQHGIGHGVMAAIAGDPLEAVAVCDSLEKAPGVTRPCIEGVIMEFNMRQVEQISPVSVRPVDERGYYYPCTEMPETDRDECFFEQTRWWREIFGRYDYSAIGGLCDGIEDSENRSWCYRAIGYLIPEYAEDPIDTLAGECLSATQATEGQALCLQVLRNVMKADSSVCDLLQGEDADVCRSPMPELIAG
jgi:hypothetical protein